MAKSSTQKRLNHTLYLISKLQITSVRDKDRTDCFQHTVKFRGFSCSSTLRCTFVFERDSEMSHLFFLRLSVDNKLILFQGMLDQMWASKIFPWCVLQPVQRVVKLTVTSVCYLYHMMLAEFEFGNTCWLTRTHSKTSKRHHTLPPADPRTQTLITKSSKTEESWPG